MGLHKQSVRIWELSFDSVAKAAFRDKPSEEEDSRQNTSVLQKPWNLCLKEEKSRAGLEAD